LDGGNGRSTTLHTGIDDENRLKNIYIRATLDTSPVIEVPIVEEEAEEETNEETETLPTDIVEIEDPAVVEESFAETEEVIEAQPLPPTPEVPLVLWIGTNDLFYTHHTRSGTWKDTTTPQIVSGELAIQSLVVANNRAWIATANGLATVSVQ
jgi:hypothetical protein